MPSPNGNGYAWRPITDLPADVSGLADPSLPALAQVWSEQAVELRKSEAYERFLAQLRREHAIETGIIERLYHIDRSITLTLIEQGLDAALIPHGATDLPGEEVIRIIRDQEQALEAVFDLVAQRRPLSTSYIKQLHQVLTQHQDTCEAIDSLGRRVQVSLIKGDWKKLPNNPERLTNGVPSGWKHEYCPPEHVAQEMDNLIAWHERHGQCGVPPEVEAAWLHHRFTQIHPFQDGNGRVARLLASVALIRAKWFPLVITRADLERGLARSDYIAALERADRGELKPLVQLFAARQRRAFTRALSLSDQMLHQGTTVSAVIAATVPTLARHREARVRRMSEVFGLATDLHRLCSARFKQVADELQRSLTLAGERYTVRSASAENATERDRHNSIQVVQGAEQLGYFANLRDYSAWCSLSLRAEVQTEILASFHGVGRDFRGVMACSLLVYQRDRRQFSGVRPLTEEPFQFSFLESAADLGPRFRDEWLEQGLVVGLEGWRRSL